jgi:hypothetical protein
MDRERAEARLRLLAAGRSAGVRTTLPVRWQQDYETERARFPAPAQTSSQAGAGVGGGQAPAADRASTPVSTARVSAGSITSSISNAAAALSALPRVYCSATSSS